MEERQVLIGGLITMIALSAALFRRGHWQGGLFIGAWAPAFFQLADALRDRVEGRR